MKEGGSGGAWLGKDMSERWDNFSELVVPLAMLIVDVCEILYEVECMTLKSCK